MSGGFTGVPVYIKPGCKYLICVAEQAPDADAVVGMLDELRRQFPGSEFVIAVGVTGIAEADDAS